MTPRSLLVFLLCAGAGAAHAAPNDAKALIARFECARCHRLPPALGKAATRSQDCRGCHARIVEGHIGTEQERATWRPKVEELADIPSLLRTQGRLRRSFVESFLLNPHDQRPALRPTMPRLPLTQAQAKTIATALTSSTPSSVAGNHDNGKALFGAYGCGFCHAFTGANAPPPQGDAAAKAATSAGKTLGQAMRLAPDLSHTRDRLEPAFIARFLVEPVHEKPDSLMPTLGVSAEDANDLAAYLLQAPLAQKSATPKTPMPKTLTTTVRYADVKARVFDVLCIHCHQTPDGKQNDGGPGVAGGFGFAARGLDLMREETFHARGLFAPVDAAGGLPRIAAALWARHEEVAGRRVKGVTGMPLGLPPLSLDDIALVTTWAQQQQ